MIEFLETKLPHPLADAPEMSARTQARVSVAIWNASAMAKAVNEDRSAAVTEIKNYFG